MGPQLPSVPSATAVVVMVALLHLLPPTEAHVALTFPPARKYALDFLDTFRTVAPCGMFKGDVVTPIESGKPLRVTWHLGYAHRGGFKIQLLDNQDKFLLDLTPAGEFVGSNDVTSQEFTVDIPRGLECQGCTIRLERQALEWGPKYRFHSCANVNILKFGDFRNDCSQHGSLGSGGRCSCRKPYYGERCELKNDCEDDSDCNNNGQCITSPGSAGLDPQKQCFCQPGHFGVNCALESPLRTKAINQSIQYNEIKLLGDDVRFLWTLAGYNNEEVEGVVVARTTSYVAIGWRPDDASVGCQKFPLDAPAPVSRDLHAMDCQDIVLAKVRGGLSNIGDYYTRDRSTPRRDAFYGGIDDLTAAIGWEEDGVTTFMFRKPVWGSRDNGEADHVFGGTVKLIWAHGQDGDAFYKEDELKYHGGNRGSYTVKFSGAMGRSSSCASLVLVITAAIGVTFLST